MWHYRLTWSLKINIGPCITGLSYQTNPDQIDFLKGHLEFRHFDYDCLYNVDQNFRYRRIGSNLFEAQAFALETDVNYKRHTFIAGISSIRQDLVEQTNSFTAPLIGLGTSIYTKPLKTSIMAKVALYGGEKEIESQLTFELNKFQCFLNYYEFDTFSELSVGLGIQLGYNIN